MGRNEARLETGRIAGDLGREPGGGTDWYVGSGASQLRS